MNMTVMLKRWLIFAFLAVAAWIRNRMMRHDNLYLLLFMPPLAGFRELVGKWKSWRAYDRAVRECPAYKAHVEGHTGIVLDGWTPRFDGVPETDKLGYVKKWTMEKRCHGGDFPTAGVQIDESSGSSGQATDWIRGFDEREAVARTMQIAFHHLLGHKPVMFINAFALGPWATGMTVSMGIIDICVLKSTGPEIVKIVNTLKKYGPKRRYIIAGYPPFLKALVDAADIDWSQYDIVAFYGGEGISEGMRSYLGKAFRRIYGSYGASDLEINVAAENDFVIALRQLMLKDHRLRRRLNAALKHAVPEEALPMVFQFNPMDYMIETNKDGELVITLCRFENVAPKIRYNIKDLGHVVPFAEVKRILAEEGYDASKLGDTRIANLPLLFHYGRSDMTVAYFGCKIAPGEVETVVMGIERLTPVISAYAIVMSADDQENKLLTVALELREGQTEPSDLEALRNEIFERLAEINQDFRKSREMVPAGKEPRIAFYPKATGPFEHNDIRVKLRYIQTS